MCMPPCWPAPCSSVGSGMPNRRDVCDCQKQRDEPCMQLSSLLPRPIRPGSSSASQSSGTMPCRQATTAGDGIGRTAPIVIDGERHHGRADQVARDSAEIKAAEDAVAAALSARTCAGDAGQGAVVTQHGSAGLFATLRTRFDDCGACCGRGERPRRDPVRWNELLSCRDKVLANGGGKAGAMKAEATSGGRKKKVGGSSVQVRNAP